MEVQVVELVEKTLQQILAVVEVEVETILLVLLVE